jgi:hypothetical protein
MDNSILISRYVQSILEEAPEIKAILGENTNKIFTLLQESTEENPLTYPYIVHSRESLTTTYSKDFELGMGGWFNTIQYKILCVSDDYESGLNLANAVRHSIETYRLKNDEIFIHPIKVYNITEYTTQVDEYVQDIQLTIVVQ